MLSKPIKSTQQKTKDFFKTVEAGDIALFDIFDEAIAIFGYTRAGKTTTCHYLSNSILRSDSKNGELYYKPITQRYNTAIVGHTTQSETQIPNIFKNRIKVGKQIKQICLLDQPGYGDTYGFHKIFSNGYFHYRTFSKTPKLKFIVTISRDELSGTAKYLKSTILNFINSFCNYEQIKTKILKASSLIITKVQSKSSGQEILKLLSTLREEAIGNLSQKQKIKYQQFLSQIINNKKVYVVHKPTKSGVNTIENNILQEIYDKTEFWERNCDNNVADMSQINFSVAGEILNQLLSYKGNELFRQEFDHFMSYTQKRLQDILLNHQYSLLKLVALLKRDSIQSVQSHKFLQGMVNFNSKYYQFSENFKQKRQITEGNLFKIQQVNQMQQSQININLVAHQNNAQKEKNTRSLYFIKKFKVLQFIQKFTYQISNEEGSQRSVAYLQKISRYFIQIFRKFNILRIQRQDSQKIIYKYSYVIQRLIEEAKILSLILFNDENVQQKFAQYRSQNIQRQLVDIIRPLKDYIFPQFLDTRVSQLKQTFVRTLNFDQFEVVNQDIVLFFESIPFLDDKIQFKVAGLILKYCQNIEHRSVLIEQQEKIFVAYKLYQYRGKFFSYLKNLQADEKGKVKKQIESCNEQIFLLTNSLGNMLASISLYEEARQVFKTINNVQLVFKMYKKQIENVDPKQVKIIRNILIQYGKFAKQSHRRELAIECFQKAYAQSFSYDQINFVAQEIVKMKISQSQQTEYIKNLYSKKFCQDFSPHLKDKIIAVFGQQMM